MSEGLVKLHRQLLDYPVWNLFPSQVKVFLAKHGLGGACLRPNRDSGCETVAREGRRKPDPRRES